MTIHRLVILLASCFLSLPYATAQKATDPREIFAEAETAYQIGRVEQAIELLSNSLGSFSGNMQQNALRLMALCYMSQDNNEEAERWAQKLLSINPYYTSVQDPRRFEDMINQLKGRRQLTVTTASNHAESLQEAPVPVTIITRDMIDRLSNNKTLGQILAYYVPALNEVSSYATWNVAMRGVYTSGQEKILIMEDGHRLNMRSTNGGKMDYAISTEKIDHIEVLRGPASSLYGNVALTAVVNIITRQGRELNGIKGKYGLGSHATHRADLIGGTTLLGADVMAWASIYTSNGEQLSVPRLSGYSQTRHDGYVYIDRYEGRPTYDLGVNLEIGAFSLMMNRKQSKLVPQYSWYAETYDYDRFRTVGGVKPGYSVDETHVELGYNGQYRQLNYNITGYGDWYQVKDYMPVSDSLTTYVFNPDGSVVIEDGKPKTKLYRGLSQILNFEEYTIGALGKMDASYTLGNQRGSLIVGAQAEYFKLAANDFMMGDRYEDIVVVYSEPYNMLKIGSETSISAFVQDKHYLTGQIILNAGLRYDLKHRASGKNVTALSPRVALIYIPGEAFSAKLSYSQSFVDAPYYTRHNSTNGARGSEDLMPEYMRAVQLDFLGVIQGLKLTYDLNLFYNHLTDIIVNNPSTDLSTPKYINAGSLKVAGVEGELKYEHTDFQARAMASYQRPLEAEAYYYTDHRIYGVPAFTASLSCSKPLLTNKTHRLWATAGAKYASKTLVKANSRIAGSEDSELSGGVTVDAGLHYAWNNRLQLSADCDNLFDRTYYVGGSFYLPYQAPGRTMMATLSVNL